MIELLILHYLVLSIIYGAQNSFIPYGFEKIDEEEKYSIYINKNFLPLAYCFNTYITSEDFKNCYNSSEREQILRQAVILEDTDVNKIEDFNLSNNVTTNINYAEIIGQESKNDDITFKDNKISINKENAILKLKFNGFKNSENYLVIKNPVWNSNSNDVKFDIYVNGKTKNFHITNSNNNFYFKKDETLINLGYYEEPINSFEISFNCTGSLEFEDFYIACNDMSSFEEDISNLKSTSVTNVKIDTNTVTAEVEANQNGILQFSIPYSIGWKLFIDNEEQELLQTDLMYMGTKITKGTHSIKLVYETPYLKEGAIISISTIIFLALDYIFRKKHNKLYLDKT